jgi:hypothetical protein
MMDKQLIIDVLKDCKIEALARCAKQRDIDEIDAALAELGKPDEVAVDIELVQSNKMNCTRYRFERYADAPHDNGLEENINGEWVRYDSYSYLKLEVDHMAEALEKAEWSSTGQGWIAADKKWVTIHQCPICESVVEQGHDHDCPIGAAIAAHRAGKEKV